MPIPIIWKTWIVLFPSHTRLSRRPKHCGYVAQRRSHRADFCQNPTQLRSELSRASLLNFYGAANYLEDKLSKRDRIFVFDGGHAAMVSPQ
jgi:hypothetical protein